MAVVSRVAKLRYQGATSNDFQEYTATATVQDTAAGSSVTVTWAQALGGISGDPPTGGELNFYVDNGATLVRQIVLNASTVQGSSHTFHFTDTGSSGGTARSGTIRLRARTFRQGTATNHDANSDSGGTAPVGMSVHTTDQGWIRGTTTATVKVSKDGGAGAATALLAYPDTITGRATLGAAPYASRTLTITLGPASAVSASSTTTTFDSALGTADSRFPAAATAYTPTITVPNATLTSQPWTSLTTTTPTNATVDPRITESQHFQVDDNAFGTAKAASLRQMLSTESGFLWSIIRNARSEGVNGLSITKTLTPTKPGSAVTGSTTTTTQDSQAGVSGRLDWTSSKPGGTWTPSGDVTSPAGISADTHFVQDTGTFTMLVADPRILVLSSAGPTSKDNHARPGEAFQGGCAVYKAGTRTTVAVDSDGAGGHKAYAAFIRLQDTGTHAGRGEYLESDGTTWTAITATGQAIYHHQLTQTRASSGIYTKTFTAEQTAGWGTYDIFIVGEAVIDGTPYPIGEKEVVIGAANRHDSFAIDPVGLALSGVMSQR